MGFGGLSIKKGPPLGKWLPGGGPFSFGESNEELEAREVTEKKSSRGGEWEQQGGQKWGWGSEKTEVVTM